MAQGAGQGLAKATQLVCQAVGQASPMGGLVSPFWPEDLRRQPALSLTLGPRGAPPSYICAGTI